MTTTVNGTGKRRPHIRCLQHSSDGREQATDPRSCRCTLTYLYVSYSPGCAMAVPDTAAIDVPTYKQMLMVTVRVLCTSV